MEEDLESSVVGPAAQWSYLVDLQLNREVTSGRTNGRSREGPPVLDDLITHVIEVDNDRVIQTRVDEQDTVSSKPMQA